MPFRTTTPIRPRRQTYAKRNIPQFLTFEVSLVTHSTIADVSDRCIVEADVQGRPDIVHCHPLKCHVDQPRNAVRDAGSWQIWKAKVRDVLDKAQEWRAEILALEGSSVLRLGIRFEWGNFSGVSWSGNLEEYMHAFMLHSGDRDGIDFLTVSIKVEFRNLQDRPRINRNYLSCC